MLEKSHDLRVLVVDDEPLIRWSIAETLSQAGLQVALAASGQETMARLGETPSPDVILLDFRLPDSDDLRLLERIRQRVPHAAVVMMTAYGSADVVEGATERGAYRVMGKPIDMNELLPLVRGAYASRLH